MFRCKKRRQGVTLQATDLQPLLDNPLTEHHRIKNLKLKQEIPKTFSGQNIYYKIYCN
jgi:hypothetical protein